MGIHKRLVKFFFALQSGSAHRVIFYYFGEDPTYLENAHVTVYRNGVVEIFHRNEHVSTHAQNVEILWKTGGNFQGKGRSLSLVKGDVSPN
jgi:hypothetical protein